MNALWLVSVYLHNTILLPRRYFTDKKVQDKGDLSGEMFSTLPLWELLCPQSARISDFREQPLWATSRARHFC